MPTLKDILAEQRNKKSQQRRANRESMGAYSLAEISFQVNLLRRKGLGAVAEATVRKTFERGKTSLLLLSQIVEVLRDCKPEDAGIFISFNGQEFHKIDFKEEESHGDVSSNPVSNRNPV